MDDEGEVEEEGRVSLGGDCWGLGLGLGVLGGMVLGDGRLVGGIGVRWWMICSSGIRVGGYEFMDVKSEVRKGRSREGGFLGGYEPLSVHLQGMLSGLGENIVTHGAVHVIQGEE